MTPQYVFYILTGFFSGSILYSYLIPRYLKHIDITEAAGDHNPGAANVFMYAGIPMGILAILCDVVKGILPVRYAIRVLPAANPLFALVLCAPVFGHAFSPFRKGKGGKAIAVSFGVLLGIFPMYHHVLILAAALIFLSLCIVIRPHRLRVICAFVLLCLWTLRTTKALGILIGVLLLSCAVLWRHRMTEDSETMELSLFGVLPIVKKTKTAGLFKVSSDMDTASDQTENPL